MFCARAAGQNAPPPVAIDRQRQQREKIEGDDGDADHAIRHDAAPGSGGLAVRKRAHSCGEGLQFRIGGLECRASGLEFRASGLEFAGVRPTREP